MNPPKHFVSAAAIVLNDQNEILLIRVSTSESLEAGFFPIEQALTMVTFMNFRERIEACLTPTRDPVYIEF